MRINYDYEKVQIKERSGDGKNNIFLSKDITATKIINLGNYEKTYSSDCL